jgi:hypothetical protein
MQKSLRFITRKMEGKINPAHIADILLSKNNDRCCIRSDENQRKWFERAEKISFKVDFIHTKISL